MKFFNEPPGIGFEKGVADHRAGICGDHDPAGVAPHRVDGRGQPVHRVVGPVVEVRLDPQHADTALWGWQAATGIVLLFLATVHLFGVLRNPGELGPVDSARQVWSEGMLPLYVVLLPAVELHVGFGLYRLAMKWGWLQSARPAVVRGRLKRVMWGPRVSKKCPFV